ncbi:MAG: PQQ-like beta-propeller repeat protein [Lentisphaerae bacterium]|nr:PQQ-like beta-propeller repeat protein [Lentisphaerota bacterium]MBT4815663.1 PQQ-like beta-propeller repeat protein [Lentisphaerota bacterium]MBT5610334.1 PQQ-like beta-propeller repeat protein [Lentisphaerota bacterium]MBT7056162.1 PQQ-like beta-propeller repeat protein [Lentisphaerota bacterium]MBT7841916.1 PQQ-like beta-propeller repeat protein [Lentisphaerota bacterium]
MKAPSQDGPFVEAFAIKGSWIRSSRPYTRKKSRRPPYWKGSLVVFDRDVQPFRKMWYRCELRKRNGTVVDKGSTCSVVVMQLPDCRLRVDEEGHPIVAWDGLDDLASRVLVNPKIGVQFGPWFSGLFPCSSGEFRVPLSRRVPVQGDGTVRLLLMAETERTRWEVATGHATATEPVHLEAAIGEAEAPMKVFAQGGSGGGTFRLRWSWDALAPGTRADRTRLAWQSTRRQVSNLEYTVSSPSRGTALVLPQTTPHEYSYLIQPGFPEPLHFQLTRTNASERRELRSLKLQQPPAVLGFRATEGDGLVTLSWDPLDITPEHWLNGPTLTIWRTAEKLPNTGTSLIESLQRAKQTLTHTIPVTAISWTDKNVLNGRAYSYTLILNGVIKCVSQLEDASPFTHGLPVRYVACVGREGTHQAAPDFTVVAIPHRPRPLRVALLEKDSVDGAELGGRILARLVAEPWIECLERTIVPQLYEEKALDSFTTSSVGDEQEDSFVPADAFLTAEIRPVGFRRAMDIWLEEVRNGRLSRLCSIPMPASDTELDVALQNTVDCLRERFPGSVAENSPDTALAAGRAPVLAVAPFAAPRGLEASMLASGAFEDLLQAQLTEGGLVTVDRSRVSEAVSELGNIDRDDAETGLLLGKLLGADYIITGRLEGTTQAVELTLRAVEARSGRVADTWRINNNVRDYDGLAKHAVQALAGLPQPAPAASHVSPLWQQLDSAVVAHRVRKWGYGKLLRYNMAGAAPPEEIWQFAMFLRSMEKPGQALSLLKHALTKAEKQASSGCLFRFYSTLSELYREGGHWHKDVLLWAGAAAHLDKKGGDASQARVYQAEALFHLGRTEEALQVLPSVRVSGHREGRLYEELGKRSKAVVAYLRGVGNASGGVLSRLPTRSPYEATQCRAALVRLLAEARGNERVKILRGLATFCVEHQSHQVVKACALLEAEGEAEPQDYWQGAFCAACVGNWEEAERWAAHVLVAAPNMSPEDLVPADDLVHLARPPDHRLARAFAGKLEAAVRHRMTHGARPSLRTCARQAKQLLNEARECDPETEHRRPPKNDWAFGNELKETYVYHPTPDKRATPDTNRAEDGYFFLHYTGYLSRFAGVQWRSNGYPLVDQRRMVWCCDLRPGIRAPSIRNVTGGRPFRLAHYVPTLVMSGNVFATAWSDGVLHAVEAGTGKEAWRFTAWGELSPPIRVRDHVVAATEHGDLLFFEPSTGELVKRIVHEPCMEKYIGLAPMVTYCRDKDQIRFSYQGKGTVYTVSGPELGVAMASQSSNDWGLEWDMLSVQQKRDALEHPSPGDSSLADGDAVPLWLHAMLDTQEDKKVRSAAMKRVRKVLERMPRGDAVEALRHMAANRSDSTRFRIDALYLLYQTVGRRATSACLDATSDPNDDLGRRVLKMLLRKQAPLLKQGIKRFLAARGVSTTDLAGGSDAVLALLDKHKLTRILLEWTQQTGHFAESAGWTRGVLETHLQLCLAEDERYLSPQAIAAVLRVGSKSADELVAERFGLVIQDDQFRVPGPEWDLPFEQERALLQLLQQAPDVRFREPIRVVLDHELDRRYRRRKDDVHNGALIVACRVLKAMDDATSIPLMISALSLTRWGPDREIIYALRTLTGTNMRSPEAWWKWYLEREAAERGNGRSGHDPRASSTDAQAHRR